MTAAFADDDSLRLLPLAKKSRSVRVRQIFIRRGGKDIHTQEKRRCDSSSRPRQALTRKSAKIASEGLNPAAPGARVAVSNSKRQLVDGPFTESKVRVGGFYFIDAKVLDETMGWALRAPCGMGSDDILEIRQLTRAGDLPPGMLEIILRTAAPTWSASVWQARARALRWVGGARSAQTRLRRLAEAVNSAAQ